MDIIVCIKRVPDTAEIPVTIDADEKGIKEDQLTFDINEADSYALEEALLIKEKFGGSVSVISIGNEDTDEILRMGLAKGADSAIRIWDDNFACSDGYTTARILSKALQNRKFDLILTGCMATDDGYSQVGPALAELLDIPHASFVTKAEINEKTSIVQRELEGGLLEKLEMSLPALITIQTGINKPRYASMLGIRKAARKEIEFLGLNEIGLEKEEVGEAGSKTRIEKIYIPPILKRAEILEGTSDEVSAKLAEVLKGKGVL
ncbi:MAG: electron transfer flavoprotein subunit beta/FixA family protein [bacterium]